MKKEKAREKKTAGRIIGDVFTTVVLLAVGALVILFLGVRLVGLTPYAVQTASMEPTYHVGSLVYVKSTPPEDVKVGDAITYSLNAGGLIATHRVAAVDTERQLFYTKGDAAEDVDATPVPWSALIGLPKFSIPKLGFLAEYTASRQGRVIAVTVAAILLVLAIFPQLLASAEKSDRKKKAADEGKADPIAGPPDAPSGPAAQTPPRSPE